jgi:hypothetical protein
MFRRLSVLVGIVLTGYCFSSVTTAQNGAQPQLPKGVKSLPNTGPAPTFTPPPVQKGGQVPPNTGPATNNPPNLPKGVQVLPSIRPNAPFTPPRDPEPTPKKSSSGTATPAAPKERTVFHLTNVFEQNVTIHLKFVTPEGEVRLLKVDRAPTAEPGEKVQISVPHDIATVKEGSETKYLVAFRGVREGFNDVWWGVKAQNGKVEDKNEFVGLTFTSFTTDTNGRKTKNLNFVLRPRK